MKYCRIIIFLFIVYVLACFTTYFSMNEYSNDISSSCFDCTYKRDVFLFSTYVSIIFLLLELLRRNLKKKWNIAILYPIIFLIVVFFNNYNIFIDRVSSWSSYNTMEELLSVVSNSYLYLSFSTILLIILLKLFRF
jgi:hypothetical protein